VLHLHDWQAGLVPVYLREMGASDRVGTLLTVHNIAFHGMAPAAKMKDLRLPQWGFHPDGFEYYGQIDALKAGLVFSDKLSTVSPTYARELMQPEFGMGLDGVLRARKADLVGILNGIDETVWDPKTDPGIANYKSPKKKAPNRALLIEEFGLAETDGPLAIVISRLTEQKGLDLLLQALPDFITRGGQVALLGSGDTALETAWIEAAEAMPQVSVRIGYDEQLSHRMMAGGDAVIVPSRFEPCGLTQLYGLRYGAVPVVAMTGGLADTVIPANDAALAADVATGFQFFPVTADALSGALMRLCDVFGATFDGDGVNFAVFSEHASRMTLCLFSDGRQDRDRSPRSAGTRRRCLAWLHVRPAPGAALYGYRAHGPYRPDEGHRFNPQQAADRSLCQAADRPPRMARRVVRLPWAGKVPT
jgi:starch synthase